MQKDLWAAAIILIPVVVPTTVNNPIYDEFVDGWQNTAAIYGTEYQASTFPDLKNLDQHDAPCAAYYVRTRGSQIMIPGTNKCPSGWTREYKGHLMTSHYNHAHSSDYVCTDEGGGCGWRS